MGYRDYSTCKGLIVDPLGHGDFTTISAALLTNTASKTIFLRPGNYQEDITITQSTTFYGDSSSLQGIGNVGILGKITIATAGLTVNFNNIGLSTYHDYLLTLTAASTVLFTNCFFGVTNTYGINADVALGTSNLYFVNCSAFITSTYGFLNSTNVPVTMIGCSFLNSNVATTSYTNTSWYIYNSILTFPITVNSGGGLYAYNSVFGINSPAINTTWITNDGNCSLDCCTLYSGTASAISIGSGATLMASDVSINSSNTNAIAGSGTIEFGEIDFTGSSSTIQSTLTATSLVSQMGQLNLNTALTVPNGGTGAKTLTGVVTGNGTSAMTANAVTQHGVLIGGASNAVSSLGVAASNSVLQGSTGADPSFTTTPQLVGLGIGAASTGSGLTFDGVNTLANYVTGGTFTPTLAGGTTAGTTTYTLQYGYYTLIGNIVQIIGYINCSAATGTGIIVIGGLPFTIANNTDGQPLGIINLNGVSWLWPTGSTMIQLYGTINAKTANIVGTGSGIASTFMAMTNAAVVMRFQMTYLI